MKALFYSFVLVLICYNLFRMVCPLYHFRYSKTLKYKAKYLKGEKWTDLSKSEIHMIFTPIVLLAITFIVYLGGLFTFNWLLFLVMLILGTTIFSWVNKLVMKIKNEYIGAMIVFVFALIDMVVLSFALINSYHLKINLWEFVKNLF